MSFLPFPLARHRIVLRFASLLALLVWAPWTQAALRAGAFAQDITPTQFPVIVNGGFNEMIATKANDALHARAIVLDDGKQKIAIVVVDSCMLPRELLDDAKQRANRLTGIPVDRMLISATHSHTAPSSMGCLGSDADANYVKILPDLLARAIDHAKKNLAPAKIGFAVVNDSQHTASRRWVFRPDRMRKDPFGELTVRATMHPGYQSPDAIGPTGPIDPGLSIISIQHADGQPLALLANYSMHYVGTKPLSADYYGRFCARIQTLLKGDETFVGVMAQGTSGDMWLADYSKTKPQKPADIDTFAEALADKVAQACKSIRYRDDAPIVMRETTLKLMRRLPDEKRLTWARERVAALGNAKPKTQADIYAREAIFLHDDPERELKLQAIRVGDIAIAAIPNEIYALTGLKIKAMSSLPQTFTIGLANGSEGYIPPPEQHKLGGYTTWPARTAALEPQAEPKIVEATIKLLEEVSGQKRRKTFEPASTYSNTILADKPAGYWRMDDMAGPICRDTSGNGLHGIYEDGVLFYLPGVPNAGADVFTSRAAHFAGGRMTVRPQLLEGPYSVEFSFWNGLSNEARPMTAYLFSRGPEHDAQCPGDHLGIAGTLDGSAHLGKLIFYNGEARKQLLIGTTTLEPHMWYHVVLVRDGKTVRAWVNGKLEIDGQAEVTSSEPMLFFGGRSDNLANLEGKLDEISLYRKALSAAEVTAHFNAENLPTAHAMSNAKAATTQAAGQPTRHPPRSPGDSMKSIHISPDLSIELVASEPLIASPVAIDWGNDGKLWVVEMADYPYGMDGKGKPGGRIKYLESIKNDGHYDKATLFMDDIKMPNGIIAWRKGVIVTAATEIFYAEDNDGDGKADRREVLFKGFKEGNPQLRANGLRWGLDNWLYVASGLTGGVIESIKTHEKLDLKGHDLRIRPDTGEMELVSGPSQFGREHDNAGRWFGTDNSHPLFHYVLEDRYLKRNPHLTASDPKQQLLPLPLPPVFPRSPFAKRYIGLDHHGHFTSACGISIYRDELLFGSKDQSTHALICEPVHNLVQHQVLTASGVTFTAQRLDGEKGADFIASEDNWFRPVMTRCGPDGAIYVVDMYRYMIEHPDWLNAVGKAELAPYYRDGAERGRIYRIVPKSGAPRAVPRLDQLDAAGLVALLESPSGFLRDRAQMLLVQQSNPTASVPLLTRLFSTTHNPLARLHALCTLDGLQSLTPDLLKAGLADSDASIRATTLKLCETTHDTAVLERLPQLVFDPSPMVHLQLACTLGEFDAPQAGRALAQLAKAGGDDPFLAAAIGSSAARHSKALLAQVLADPTMTALPLFQQLVQMSVATKDLETVAALLDRGCADDPASRLALARMADVLAVHGLKLEEIAARNDHSARLRAALARAASLARDEATPLTKRKVAVNLLGRTTQRRPDDLQIALSLLSTTTPGEIQSSALRAAARCTASAEDQSLPTLLLKRWSTLSPALRGGVADTLLPRESWALALAQSPAARDLDFSRRQRLLNHPSAKVKQAAKATLAQVAVNADRQKVIDRYQSALTLRGDPAHGEALFAEHCATCHRVGASRVGHDIGPNLLTVRDWPAENLLTALLDPDRNVEPRFVVYTATMNDGTTLAGLLTGESAGNVIVKTLDDLDHPIPRAALKSLVSSEHSLMPQGFEAALEPTDVADLMAFLRSPTAGE